MLQNENLILYYLCTCIEVTLGAGLFNIYDDVYSN